LHNLYQEPTNRIGSGYSTVLTQSGTGMHTVSLVLARGAADRPAGPTLCAGGWTLDGAVALQRQPKAGTGHSSSAARSGCICYESLVALRNGWASDDDSTGLPWTF